MRWLHPSQVTPSLLEIDCEESCHCCRGHRQFCFTQPLPPGFMGGNHVGTCRREEGLSPLQFLQESLDFCFKPELPPSVIRESLLHQKEAVPSAHHVLLTTMHSSFCRAACWVQFFGGLYVSIKNVWSLYCGSAQKAVEFCKEQLP